MIRTNKTVMLAFVLFILMSPGFIFNIPPMITEDTNKVDTGGWAFTLSTSVSNVLVHAVLFALLFDYISKRM